jgi:hypothetical protein
MYLLHVVPTGEASCRVHHPQQQHLAALPLLQPPAPMVTGWQVSTSAKQQALPRGTCSATGRSSSATPRSCRPYCTRCLLGRAALRQLQRSLLHLRLPTGMVWWAQTAARWQQTQQLLAARPNRGSWLTQQQLQDCQQQQQQQQQGLQQQLKKSLQRASKEQPLQELWSSRRVLHQPPWGANMSLATAAGAARWQGTNPSPAQALWQLPWQLW